MKEEKKSNIKQMRILFFLVHPAKFWMFRNTINHLKAQGHIVEFMTVEKDVMTDLLKAEGWEYINIMPKGRRINWLPRKLGAMVLAGITLLKVFAYTLGKHYDLFITTDVLAFVGWIRRVPTLIFFDDDLEHMPEYAPIIAAGTKLVTPAVSEFKMFEKKQIKYKANHEWAYVNPKYFRPNIKELDSFNPSHDRYFIVRLVSFTATHDSGKQGVSDEKLERIINVLSKYGKIFLDVEKTRALPEKFEKYRLKASIYGRHSVTYFADLYVGDSHTMLSEAALMGVPAVRLNSYVGHCKYMEEEDKYGLSFGYLPSQFEEFMKKIEELAKNKNIKQEWKKKLEKWDHDHIDATQFYIDLIESYGKKK